MIRMAESAAIEGQAATLERNRAQEDRAVAGLRGGARSRGITAVPSGLAEEAAMRELRRLGYFRDLLLQGFESTAWPERATPTLRAERLALGIDLPELDTVALWSTRCGGGMLSIPFIEYILARIRESAARFAPVDLDGEIGDAIDQLDAILAWVTPAGGDLQELPRLGDVYLPELEVARLCSRGGLLDRILDSCQAGVLRAPHTAAR